MNKGANSPREVCDWEHSLPLPLPYTRALLLGSLARATQWSGTVLPAASAGHPVSGAPFMLESFIATNRDEIIARCRAKVATRLLPPPTAEEIGHGVPLFLDQLMEVLRLGLRSDPEIGRSAIR